MGTPAPGGQGDEDSSAEELERVAWKRQEDIKEDVKTWVPEEGGARCVKYCLELSKVSTENQH